MTTASNFYRRIVGNYNRALKRCPDSVEDQMLELGDLIASFAPYVGTAKVIDENDIQQIIENSGYKYFDAIKNLDVFATNLRGVFDMSQNSFQYTSEEGDLILKQIAAKCQVIAALLG